MADATPRELFDAIGDLALAIKPHYMDSDQRRRIKAALHTLVDNIIAVGERKRGEHQPKENTDASSD